MADLPDPKFTTGRWDITVRWKKDRQCGPGIWINSPGHKTVVDTGAMDVFPLSPADKALIESAPEMYDELARLLPVMESAPEPKLGQIDWPKLARGVRAILLKANPPT